MKIVLAMSGGVDSGCAGAVLRRAGHEVIGVTMLVEGSQPTEDMDSGVRECCGKLGIEHHYIDVSSQFQEQVILPAAREYACGRTPNPCCICNPVLKFGLLADFARSRGADRLATGHYVRKKNDTLLRGYDSKKDQSYFLALLDKKIIPFLEFPLGELEKETVRMMTEDMGFKFYSRRDSEELCFVPPGENSGDELFRRAGLTPRPGKIYFRGKKVGTHQGVHRITIGQRQGLGVALGVPAFVTSIDGRSARVEMETDSSALLRSNFLLTASPYSPLPEPGDYEVQIRFRSKPVPCRLEKISENCCRITVSQPVRAVTPGQIGALYHGKELCGGGIIQLEEQGDIII